MQEMQVWSLGWKGPLEKEMATHSSILAWEIPWTEETGGLQFMRSQRVGYDLATKQQQQYNHVKSLRYFRQKNNPKLNKTDFTTVDRLRDRAYSYYWELIIHIRKFKAFNSWQDTGRVEISVN